MEEGEGKRNEDEDSEEEEKEETSEAEEAEAVGRRRKRCAKKASNPIANRKKTRIANSKSASASGDQK